MCGIYGMISKFKKNSFINMDVAIFHEMAIMTSLRGRDSSSIWGIYKEHPTRDPRIWKKLGDPFYLLNGKEGEQIEKFMINDAIAMFGHGRKATLGKVSIANAHPFRHGPITLMHNGTIHGGLEKKEEVEVDSHALTILVQEKGVQKALSSVDGAFAIISYDTVAQKLFIARNHQRPLHYVETNDMIYIMSDKKPLEYLLDRSNRHNAWIKEFEGMKVYEIDLNAPKMEDKKSISYPKSSTWTNYGTGYGDYATPLLPPDKKIVVPFKPKTFDDSTWKLKRGEQVKFIIEDVIKPDGSANYRYWGQDDEGNVLVFFAPDMHADWVGRLAMAPVVNSYPDKVTSDSPEIVYIVKLSEVKWLPSWNDLSEKQQQELLVEGRCAICSQAFVDDDIDNIIVLSKQPVTAAHGECDHLNKELEDAIKRASANDSDNIPV